MKKLIFVLTLAVALLVGTFAVCVRAADLKDPKEIIKKSQVYALSLDSYTFQLKGEGWDMNPSDVAKRTSVVAGEASQKFGAVKDLAGDVKKDADKNKSAVKPVYKRYEFIYKFKKPYLLQMHVIMSDYVPKIIYGSNMTYRPDQDPAVFWFKPKISPFAIKRPIDSESGNLLYSVITVNYAEMDAMSKDTKPVFKGISKVGGRDAYMVEFSLNKNKKKLAPHDVDFKKWGIPKEAQQKFKDEINGYTTDFENRSVFYFDKENLLIVQREDYDMDNKFLGRKIWQDFKVNGLSEKDF